MPRETPGLPMDADSAADIFQRHLDATTKLVFAGHVEAFADHIMLPYVFRTAAGEDIAESRDELLSDIRKINAWLTSQGATDFHRIVHKARFLDDTSIEGTHVSYILRGAIPINDPYRSRMILKRDGDTWRAAYSEHELADALFPARDTRPRPGVFLSEDGFGSDPVIHDTARALPLYQGVIDTMSDLNIAGDFEGWMDLFTDPYDIHYEGRDFYATSPLRSRPFFDALVAEMAQCGADRLVREASFAAFLSADRLMGYHQTTMRKGDEVRFGPIQSRMILNATDEGWKCASVTNSLANTDKLGAVFEIADHLPTLREIHGRKTK
ncbi:hypothetical protein [Hasllibacter sp. MH4015]|uniref:hypothetical protein n=1 Tax=Hasllibacter sp. MH4015 TaxID=2854029 RepID=UPI001CD4718D|nr:hypothetical protein [Hasllibacter sp. MH4015]